MSSKITHDQKETAIEALKEHGTMQYASKICGVTVRTLNEEMRRSEVFKRRVLEARAEGKTNIADGAIELIKDYAYGKCAYCHGSKTMLADTCPYCKGTGLPSKTDKTDRNRLTAAIALANAYEPGFRGQTMVQGRIEHDVRVITAVPRPNYNVQVEARETLRQIDKGKEKAHTVEEAIEGEVIET